MMELSESDVRALALAPRAWREAIASVYGRLARGQVQVAPKAHLQPSPEELLIALPALDLERGYSACKWVNVVPASRAAGGPTVNSVLVLNDWRTGRPLALIAADGITAERTAAMSAVAARHYARHDSTRIGFVGCGVQARSHFAALRDLFPGLQQATVFGRRIESARIFADELCALGVQARASSEARDAVAGQDLIVTTVPGGAQEALLDPGWLAAGAFVAAVDLGRSWRRSGLSCFAQVVTDERAQSVALGREGRLVSAGPFAADLADIAGGRAPPPDDAGARTLFAFSGHGAADLAGAILVYEAALRARGAEMHAPA
ncbi:MAG: ornithine cyclodeaminase family protein [Comamonadaceae bacterium]|nr:ornithine cyclodeaminase family protein [Rubrivivax sp.]NLZ42039.1 ornithine cyclodeaminase family protein [Comamonadaceae bacterium]